MKSLSRLGIGILATAVLLTGQMLFEGTDLGHSVDVKTYEYLQSVLPPLSGEKLPIVVVDISQIPGGKDRPTPRAPLRNLLEAIAAKSPRAIAVDVDFSPTEYGWVTPEDPAFFDFCLALSGQRRIPIYLGVFRTRAEKPNTWLGLPQYQDLAAAGLANGSDTRRLPRWVRSTDSAHPLPALGEAIASAYRANAPPPNKWIAWALVPREVSQASGNRSTGTIDVLVNYSKLQQLKSEHLVISRPETVKDEGEELRGRLLLLGDVSTPMDTFNVPGQALPVPGVYLMASEAYTIAFEPLFEFTRTTRICLDITISLIIILGAQWLSVRSHRGYFIFVSISLVLIVGFSLVRFASIMWLDFFLVLLAILLHPRVEDWLSSRFRKAPNVSGS
jgi:CHASE2 domain-containing sensor protein